jgi:hypothetical protein
MERRMPVAVVLFCCVCFGCGDGGPPKKADPDKAKSEMKQLQDIRNKEAETGKK